MSDDRTPILQLPLPHPDHLLSDDVLRLREAFIVLDTGFGAQRSDVQAELTQARSDVDAALVEATQQFSERLHRQHLRVFHHFDF